MLTHLDAEGRTARMTVFLRAANYSRTGAVLAAAAGAVRRRLGPAVSATPFGDGWIGYLTVRALVVGQVWSIVLSVGADLLLLLLIFRSLRTALVALLPVTLSVLVVFASLAATGTPLGTANSLFASITLGIGVDYSIHLVAFCRRARLHGVPPPAAGPLGVLPSAAGLLGVLPSVAGPLGVAPASPPAAGRPVDPAISWAVAGTGPAILTSAIAIVAGFAVLLFSAVPPNRELGLLVCFTMALCAVMTLVLAPSLLLAPRGDP
jgi:predicted RND superfamily exporter protein